MPTHILTACEAREAYHSAVSNYCETMRRHRAKLAPPSEVKAVDEAVDVATKLYLEALKRPVEQMEFFCGHK